MNLRTALGGYARAIIATILTFATPVAIWAAWHWPKQAMVVALVACIVPVVWGVFAFWAFAFQDWRYR